MAASDREQAQVAQRLRELGRRVPEDLRMATHAIRWPSGRRRAGGGAEGYTVAAPQVSVWPCHCQAHARERGGREMDNQGQDTPALRVKIEAWAREHLPASEVHWTSDLEHRLGASYGTQGSIIFERPDGRSARVDIRKDEEGNLRIGTTTEGSKPPGMDVAGSAVHDALRADPPHLRPE